MVMSDLIKSSDASESVKVRLDVSPIFRELSASSSEIAIVGAVVSMLMVGAVVSITMALLSAKLRTAQQDAAAREQSATRKSLVGSGDRSERIRTYNYPQGRVTDHRINLTLYKLDEILEGNLDDVIGPLVNEFQAEQLAALAE